MTAADDLAQLIGRDDATGLEIVYGVVVSSPAGGNPIRVDSKGMQLACYSLDGVNAQVGDAVFVTRLGTKNTIIGVDTTLPVIYQHGVRNLTTTGAAFGTITFDDPFPNACDGIVFANSISPTNALISVNSLSAAAASIFVIASNTGGGLASTNLPALFFWAWGR